MYFMFKELVNCRKLWHTCCSYLSSLAIRSVDNNHDKVTDNQLQHTKDTFRRHNDNMELKTVLKIH